MNCKCNYCVYGYTTILSETGMGCNNLNLCTDNSLFKPTEEWIEMTGRIKKENKEMVNHPSHYNKGKYEAIEVFKSITGEMTRLFEIKNKNYGNSFSKQFDEYGLTSVCIRLEDKLNRLKSLNKQISEAKNGIVDINVDDESIKDTLIDLANYSVLAIMEISKGE